MKSQERNLKKKFHFFCCIIFGLILVHSGIRAQDASKETSPLFLMEFHVAKNGSDENTGTMENPFLTIQQAANVAKPGDVIIVHEGVYREQVNPPRGGTSEDRRIVYQAAPGEKVVIKGSEIIKNWEKVQDGQWKVTISNQIFGAYNPYNHTIGGEWYNTPPDGFNRHTGAVYLNGHWLPEAPVKEGSSRPDTLFNLAWLQATGYGTKRISATSMLQSKGVQGASSKEEGSFRAMPARPQPLRPHRPE